MTVFNRLLSITLLTFTVGYVSGQSFTATPLEHNMTVEPTSFVVYNYISLENLTNKDLQLRWKKVGTTITPTNWYISIQDHDTFHYPADTVDSGDFTLPVVWDHLNKFILQVYPEGDTGSAVFKFKIFDINNPDDSIRITYNVVSKEKATGLENQGGMKPVTVYPNPSSSEIKINAKLIDISVIDVTGREVSAIVRKQFSDSETVLDVEGLPEGIYFIKGSIEGQEFVERFYKQ